jgi:predicted metal-binding protein
MENKLFEGLCAEAIRLGAYKASVIGAADVALDRRFRDMCAVNSCGMYGRCYMCPPDVGDIDTLMAQIGEYEYALVYQTVSELEDSYDFEGMVEAKKRAYPIAQSLRDLFSDMKLERVLHLCAGGCGVCERCAKQTGEPCRFPNLAMPSLEAYGVNVSELARSAGMKYINGQNTVTYFGAVLFCTDGDENE